VFEGSGTFSSASQPFGVLTETAVNKGETLIRERTGNRSLVLFDSGDEVTVQASEEGIRFLLVSGKPIEEPVAWYGQIVMNTQAEVEQAFAELRNGTFIEDCTSLRPKMVFPCAARCHTEDAVGRFIFFDQMGPAQFIAESPLSRRKFACHPANAGGCRKQRLAPISALQESGEKVMFERKLGSTGPADPPSVSAAWARPLRPS
jgi:pirin-like protein